MIHFIRKIVLLFLGISLIGAGPGCFSGSSNPANSVSQDSPSAEGGQNVHDQNSNQDPITVASGGIQPLDSGVLAPTGDVGGLDLDVINLSRVEFCSFQNKIKLHLKGSASYLNEETENPNDLLSFENGRIIRLIDTKNQVYFDTKIFSETLGYLTLKGRFEATLVLDEYPIKILSDNKGLAKLFFSVAPADFKPLDSDLDNMKGCSKELCENNKWGGAVDNHLSLKVVEAAKKLKPCPGN